MTRKRIVTGREGQFPPEQATVATYGESIPRPREAKSSKSQLRGKSRHGTRKDRKVPMKEKLV